MKAARALPATPGNRAVPPEPQTDEALGPTALDLLCVNAIRVLAVDAVERAGSGHPGAPMGLAPAAYVLWTGVLRHDPADPAWPDRDRFVLSAGHASMLLYALLHLCGYDLSLDDIRRFRSFGSRTPGHPEHGVTPGVETTTGPLGQGLANAVGMAIAERLLARRFNRPGLEVVDHRVFAICSDGDLMEGVSHEAASLAGHLGLGRLVVLYDANNVTIDGPAELSFSEDVAGRFSAYGWDVHRIEDGADLGSLAVTIRAALADEDRPSLIVVPTTIAEGAPTKAGTAAAHGAPLGAREVSAWKRAIGWPEEPFHVPLEVRDRFAEVRRRGARLRAAWTGRFRAWRESEPELAREWDRVMARRLPAGWWAKLAVPAGTVATRKASGEVLASLAVKLPELVGGSADLTESTGAAIPGEEPFRPGRPARFLHFGVREHAMGGILNGISLHGGLRPYGSTFLVFSDYLRPSIRLAALMRQPVIYVFTHDSIGLGEDGPTHQPVEHLASLRAIPNLVVIRPADAPETAWAWRVALARTRGPTAIVLTRQAVPVLDRDGLAPAKGLVRGAYVLADLGPVRTAVDAAPRTRGRSKLPDLVLIATGSEVAPTLEAGRILAAEGAHVRVVSMPSWELFQRTPAAYRDRVLPGAVRVRVAVEAGATQGWHRWVGDAGAVVGLDRFGASAPGPVLMEQLGFTPERIADVARGLLR